MKGVSKDDVAEDVVWAVVGHVNGGVELKIARQVTSKSSGDRVARATLEIELGPPGLVEIVSPAQDGFSARAGTNPADDEFVVLGVVTCLDEGLRINMTVGRPIDRPNGQQPRFFLNEAEFRSEDYFVRFEPPEDCDFGPFQKADFELSFVGVANALALDLGADGDVALRLQIGCYDLAQAFSGGVYPIACNQGEED